MIRAPQIGRRFGYFAGDDDVRIETMEWAFGRKDITHVWVTRGLYGMTRIAGRLPWKRFAATGKTFLAYSDATAFLHPLAAAGGRAFHAPMLSTDMADGGSKRLWESLRNMVFGPGEEEYAFPARWLSKGRRSIAGPILPGNITMLAAMAGTPHFPSGAGKVIFLEEIGEEPYSIDRMLMQLLDAGLFRRARGVVFGWMTDCAADPTDRSLSLGQVLARFVRQTGLPAVVGFPFGHHVVNSVLPVNGWIAIRDRRARVAIKRPR